MPSYKETLTHAHIRQDLLQLAKTNLLINFLSVLLVSILLFPLLCLVIFMILNESFFQNYIAGIIFCALEGGSLLYVLISAIIDFRAARGNYMIYERTLIGKAERCYKRYRKALPHRLFFRDFIWNLRMFVKHYIWCKLYMTDTDIFKDSEPGDSFLLIGSSRSLIYIGYNKKHFEPADELFFQVEPPKE